MFGLFRKDRASAGGATARVRAAGIAPPCAQKIVQCESDGNGVQLLQCGAGGATLAPAMEQAAAVKKYKKWDSAS